MDAEYKVCKIENVKTIQVQVPGSKSITNRALLLAALSNKKCILRGVLFSDDSRGFLDCLIHLGFQVEIREEIQEVMLEKLQMILDEKYIRGIGENGTEYTVIATVLNLPKDILRMIQKFDFTKKNPKLIYVNAPEQIISLEDTILVTFLNLIGFDILFFIPTGYQSVEKYLNQNVMEEHQIGEYVYDLQVPDLKNTPFNKPRQGWRNKIFKRGN